MVGHQTLARGFGVSGEVPAFSTANRLHREEDDSGFGDIREIALINRYRKYRNNKHNLLTNVRRTFADHYFYHSLVHF